MNKKNLLILLSVITAALFLASCFSATAPTIEVGGETFPTLYSVVGEKKITGTSKSIGTGGAEVELTYRDVAIEELNSYIETLAADGYFVTQETQTTGTSQSYQIGKEASSDGNIILISFLLENDGSSVIHYFVGPGTITPELD